MLLPRLLTWQSYFIIPPARRPSKHQRREGRVDASALYFVDGNNVMGSRPDGWWRDRRGAARRLVRQVAALAQSLGGRWTVVFDGRAPRGDAALPPSQGVTVEYAARPGRNGADDHIVRLLEELPPGSRPLLFTSDRGLRERAIAAGANIEGSRSLLDRIARLQPEAWAEDPGSTGAPPHRGLSVRPAAVDDVPLIFAFIHDLAEYEQLAHQVQATEESVREEFFGERPRVEALIGFVDGEPAGFAVYFHTFSTFAGRQGLYLEDIYVSPKYRSRGLGTLLMRRVAAVAVERGCGRFEWTALDWNTDAHRLYERLGAEMSPNWRLFRITGEALRRLGESGS